MKGRKKAQTESSGLGTVMGLEWRGLLAIASNRKTGYLATHA